MSRTIVITGGTSGIGLTLKELFEKNGDNVITFSIDESSEQNHYQGSVTHEIKVNQVFNDIHEKYGNIDMLINCAGFGMSAITEIAPMEKINAVMDVNFYGTLYCSRAALRYMNAGSRIVNLSSAMALFPVPFKSIYGAAKSAVLNLSFAMKMELAPAGIDVVAICPGDTKTNFTKNRIKEFETTERYGDRLKTSTEHNDSKENKRMSVTYVANQIFKLVNKKKTKPFYIVGGKYKFLYFLTRLTPKSLLINITGKKLGGRYEAVPTKKAKAPAPVENVATQEATTLASQTMQEATMFTALNNGLQSTEESTTEVAEEQPTEIVAEENVAEPTEETPAVSQEEAKNNISNILNKITILNKPSEQKAEAEEEVAPNEQVVEDNTNTFVPEETTEEETPAEEPVAPVVEDEPQTEEVAPVEEETPAVTFEEEQPTENVIEEVPAEEAPRAFANFDALRQSVNNMQRPVETVAEPEATPVVAFDDTEEETEDAPITAETSVFATAESEEETTTPNIQFDDEEDDRLN